MIRLLLLVIIAIPLVHAETAPVADQPTALTPAGYLLYPGDLLGFKVFGHEDLSLSIRVPASGTISFPLIGRIGGVVGGRVDALTEDITRRLADGFIVDPVVTVSVYEFGPRSITAMGAVTKPGEIQLDPLSTTTALQGLAKAGGFADGADRSRAVVLRLEPGQADLRQALPIPAVDLPGDREDFALVPGDIIVVPELDRVYVIGQVQKPGAVSMSATEPLTVSKAISLTGGFDKYAKEGDVQLVRDGKRIMTVDVRAILSGRVGAVDPVLRPGDTVFVPESRL